MDATAVIVAAALGTACLPPAEVKQTKSPRPGRLIGANVALVYSKHYEIDLAGLEALHPFDIHKYRRIYLDLCRSGLVRPEDVYVPEPITPEQIRLVHSQAFVDACGDSRKVARWLEVDLVGAMPASLLDAAILRSFRWASGGTLLAGRLAAQGKVAVNLGGGYHHAKVDHGEGFNVYADMAIAIRQLRREGLIQRALIVDLDVHQGNGSAEIFRDDVRTFTFSMHQRNIYPIPKATSDLDVELKPGDGDEQVLSALERHLPDVLDRARPDVVFFQAGCDMLAGDPLAGLRMTPQGLVRRDAMVIDACAERGIGVVMTLGGGYGPDAWKAQRDSIVRTIGTHGRRSGDGEAGQR